MRVDPVRAERLSASSKKRPRSTHEIGVRIALGATAQRIVGLVVGRSVGLAVAGLVVGLGLALWGSRYLDGLQFDTSTHDPAVYGIASATLLLVAVAASVVPALRARRVDPVRSLKAE